MITPKEEELDKEITKFIAEGKHYSHIEEKLSSLLKNKDDNKNGKQFFRVLSNYNDINKDKYIINILRL